MPPARLKKKDPTVLFFGWIVFGGFGKMGKRRTLGVEVIQWQLVFYIASIERGK